MNIDRLSLNETIVSGQPEGPMFDFGSAMRVIRRRAKTILTITAVCLFGGALLAVTSSDRYVSGTSVLLEAPSLNPFGRDQVFAGTKFDNVTIESQMQVIRSPLLLSEVVASLNLDAQPIFWAPEKGPISGFIDDQIALAKSQFTSVTGIELGQEEAAPTQAELFRDAVSKLRDDVSVTRNGVTSVLSIKATANSADLAADIANAVAQAYLMQRYDMRRTSAETAAGWFETRMNELSEQAALAEGRLNAASGRASASPTLTDDARSEAMGALRDAISERIDAQARVDQISLAMRSQSPLGILPARSGSEEFAEIADAFASTTDAAERQALSAQAKQLLPGLLSDAQADLDAAKTAEAAARGTLTGAAADGSGTPSDLGRLESEARVYREMYENYTITYLRTKEQQTFPVVDASVLGIAQPPDGASGRSGMQLLLIAGLLGLTLGTGTAFAREARDPTLRTRASLAQAVGAPVLGLLPPMSKHLAITGPTAATKKLPEVDILKSRVERTAGDGNNVVPLPKHRLALSRLRGQMSMTLTHPLSPYSDTVRRIRVAFDNHFAPRHDKRGAVIGFLSDGGGTSRSTLAMNYAEMTAIGGVKTLLVDFDWLESFLSQTIAPAASFGITDLMNNLSPNFSANDAFWIDERSGLHFLPNRAFGKAEPIDPATFDTALLTALIGTLARDFDQIVIDFPSLGETVDAAGLASVVDGFVCVADWGVVDRKKLARDVANSGIPGEKIVGAVMGGVTEEDLSRYESAS